MKDLQLPALTTKTAEIIVRFKKGPEEKEQVQQLAITDTLKKPGSKTTREIGMRGKTLRRLWQNNRRYGMSTSVA